MSILLFHCSRDLHQLKRVTPPSEYYGFKREIKQYITERLYALVVFYCPSIHLQRCGTQDIIF